MERFREIAPGVLVATSELLTCTSTVVAAGDGGCLVIDPAVSMADLAALAADLDGAGLRPRAGFATRAHWDHVLWSCAPGRCAPVRGARGRGGRRVPARAAGLSRSRRLTWAAPGASPGPPARLDRLDAGPNPGGRALITDFGRAYRDEMDMIMTKIREEIRGEAARVREGGVLRAVYGHPCPAGAGRR